MIAYIIFTLIMLLFLISIFTRHDHFKANIQNNVTNDTQYNVTCSYLFMSDVEYLINAFKIKSHKLPMHKKKVTVSHRTADISIECLNGFIEQSSYIDIANTLRQRYHNECNRICI